MRVLQIDQIDKTKIWFISLYLLDPLIQLYTIQIS